MVFKGSGCRNRVLDIRPLCVFRDSSSRWGESINIDQFRRATRINHSQGAWYILPADPNVGLPFPYHTKPYLRRSPSGRGDDHGRHRWIKDTQGNHETVLGRQTIQLSGRVATFQCWSTQRVLFPVQILKSIPDRIRGWGYIMVNPISNLPGSPWIKLRKGRRLLPPHPRRRSWWMIPKSWVRHNLQIWDLQICI